MISDCKILCISDVHINHPRTKTEFILENLSKSLLRSDVLKDVQLLLIAGDFFDNLMLFPSMEVRRVNEWINELLQVCQRYDVMIRILEGTPSHDWRQSRIFTDMAKYVESKVDVKYVEELSIEYIERLDAHVLYVPDEVNDDAMVTWKMVSSLMNSMGLEKVDIACMHGVFKYQLPVESAAAHTEELYEAIVSEVIFIGHHHKHTRNGKIFAQGSFDRLCHGEEAPKGFGLMTRRNGQTRVEFVENPHAKVYKTISLIGVKPEEVIRHLSDCVDYPEGSNFRLLVESGSELKGTIKAIRAEYPMHRWELHKEGEKTNAEPLRTDQLEIPKPIAITKENIRRLILDRLDLTADKQAIFDRIMEKIA